MYIYFFKRFFLLIIPCLVFAHPNLETDFCIDEITGFIVAEAKGVKCPRTDIEVTIYDANGKFISSVKTDSNGVYSLHKKLPCGNYSAKLTANVPKCYTELSGDLGPISFTIQNNGSVKGVNFLFKRWISTPIQWLIWCLMFSVIIGLAFFLKAHKIVREGDIVEYPFFSFFHVPFHLGIYKYMLFLSAIITIIGFAICLLIYNSAFSSDIIGTIFAGPIFAYLLHILYIVEEENEEE